MKVTKAVGIQCVILVFVLGVEIIFAGRYHAIEHNVLQNEDMQTRTEEAKREEKNVLGSQSGKSILFEKAVFYTLQGRMEA